MNSKSLFCALGLLLYGVIPVFGLIPPPYSFPEVASFADVVFIGKMVGARHAEEYQFKQYGMTQDIEDLILIDLEVVESFTPGFDSEVVELFGVNTYGVGLGYRSDIRFKKDTVALFMATKTDVENQYSVSMYGYAALQNRTEELQALREWKEGGYEGDLRAIYDGGIAEKERLEKERIAREKAWYNEQLEKMAPILMIADRAERRRQLMALIEASGFDGRREKTERRPTNAPVDWRDEFWRVASGHVEVVELIECNKPSDQSGSGR
ncbi:hypothetical protein [Cerasicoccus frondis]|uniref:hypothetical protein n=1 Tax=Cerasicoccus frondis TaxID=490090 RepID=UPI00285277D1|nr:hypothetical protein [Cerasicoccus frondis]